MKDIRIERVEEKEVRGGVNLARGGGAGGISPKFDKKEKRKK